MNKLSILMIILSLILIISFIKYKKKMDIITKIASSLLFLGITLSIFFSKGIFFSLSQSFTSLGIILYLSNFLLKPVNYKFTKLNGSRKFSLILMLTFFIFIGFSSYLPTFILPYLLIGGPILLPFILIFIYLKCMKHE